MYRCSPRANELRYPAPATRAIIRCRSMLASTRAGTRSNSPCVPLAAVETVFYSLDGQLHRQHIPPYTHTHTHGTAQKTFFTKHPSYSFPTMKEWMQMASRPPDQVHFLTTGKPGKEPHPLFCILFCAYGPLPHNTTCVHTASATHGVHQTGKEPAVCFYWPRANQTGAVVRLHDARSLSLCAWSHGHG